MTEQTIQNLNLLTFCDLKHNSFEKDIENLQNALFYLQRGEKITSCHAYELFDLLITDLNVLIEALEDAISLEPDPDLCDELQERCNALKLLLTRAEELERLFQPYLYCPMKDM